MGTPRRRDSSTDLSVSAGVRARNDEKGVAQERTKQPKRKRQLLILPQAYRGATVTEHLLRNLC